MKPETTFSDTDRVRLAVQRPTRRGTIMVGPVEVARCTHGRLYSYRWTWPTDGRPEDGEAEYVSNKCRKCGYEE